MLDYLDPAILGKVKLEKGWLMQSLKGQYLLSFRTLHEGAAVKAPRSDGVERVLVWCVLKARKHRVQLVRHLVVQMKENLAAYHVL